MSGPSVFNSVFHIPPEVPFVDALAAGLLDMASGDDVQLSRMRVLLPTRRACRSLSDAFLRLVDAKAMLLPMMTPLGDVDADELMMEGFSGFDAFNESGSSPEPSSFPPAIDATRRSLLLARAIMAKENTTPDQAIMLAGELALLIDQIATERLELKTLPELVPGEDLSEHWQQTLKFLDIIAKNWPDILAGEGAIDPATRRDLLLEARAKSWAENPPVFPIIAAGSTGSIPATADLLKVVASLPQGRVVLPGLDMEMARALWQKLEPGHPQFGMAKLLNHIEIERGEVKPWPLLKNIRPPSALGARTKIINRALVPASGAGEWRNNKRDKKNTDAAALENVTRINSATPQDEAAAIALIMRHTLETPNKTAALVTPDRSLARRVRAELKRWDIAVDDSAGTPLAKTPAGAFFELVGEMVGSNFHPVQLLACLKHPLAGPSTEKEKAIFRAAVRTLETGLLRGARPGSGLAGLDDAYRVLKRDKRKMKSLQQMGQDESSIRNILLMLKDATEHFINVLAKPASGAEEILKAHSKAAVLLSGGLDDGSNSCLWAGDAGEGLSNFIGTLAGSINTLGEIKGSEYPALINALITGQVVRLQSGAHPRLFIWGLLEARLQRCDVTILGGLNEGAWPGEAKPSPWMSRPMQKQFGLPLPERRIGLSAHDFCQAFSGNEVYLTRSERVDGTPQVPSRWLVRLETMLEGTGNSSALEQNPELSWGAWVGALSASDEKPNPSVWEPKPKPPASMRPKKLSVTEVETLIRDPYAIYAKHILRLGPLDDLDADPGAAERGTIVHHALERFVFENMKSLPSNPLQSLLGIGEKSFQQNISAPTVHAFWWPRFERIAKWFVENEKTWRGRGQVPCAVEQRGEISIGGMDAEFILRARVDRIDNDAGDGLIIIDYKTGTPPTAPMVESGLSPQLSLQGAMAKQGAFKDIKAGGNISGLLYLQLSGGIEAGKEKLLKLDAEEVAIDAMEGLTKLLHRFENEKTPYLSRPRTMWKSRFGDFDHLARVKEWGSADGDDA